MVSQEETVMMVIIASVYFDNVASEAQKLPPFKHR